jgi:uracil-DNA glycosylase family 4
MTCGHVDLACTACRLSRKRHQVVPGNGPCSSSIMFFGEAPGKDEDLRGEPFVGQAGKVLDRAIEKAGAVRSRIYVGNIVKCRPPNNRKPRSDEIRTCTSLYLESEILAVGPKVICALGQTAANYFLPTKERMSDRVGSEVEMLMYGLHVRFLVAYHPAACLYQRKNQASFETSIRRALRAAGVI